MTKEIVNKAQAFQVKWFPILGEPPSIDRKRKSLKRERDYSRGRFRGLKCYYCYLSIHLRQSFNFLVTD